VPGLRLFFQNQTKEGSSLDVAVTTLSIARFGTGTTLAKPNEPVPATFTFFVTYVQSPRSGQKSAPEPFARLTGTVSLTGPTKTPVFQPDVDELGVIRPFRYLNASGAEIEKEKGRRQSIRFSYEAASFAGMSDGDAEISRLFLPRALDQVARFSEVDVRLELDDQLEAREGTNATLDVVLRPELDGPIFEWPVSLDPEVPPGLTLTLSEGDKSMSIAWTRGVVFGAFRRFTFHRLPGGEPCTLKATAKQVELTLLLDQTLGDPKKPVLWQHWLEQLLDREPAGDLTPRFERKSGVTVLDV